MDKKLWPQHDVKTDRQAERVIPIYPPNFVCWGGGGIKMVYIIPKMCKKLKFQISNTQKFQSLLIINNTQRFFNFIKSSQI